MQIYIVFSLMVFASLSCVRSAPNTEGLEHPFQQGTADHLYNREKFKTSLDILPSQKGRVFESADFFDDSKIMKKVLKIKTHSFGRPAKISTSQSGVFVEPDSKVSFVNQYYFLDYSVENADTEDQKFLARLLGKVESFKGLPNTEYYIVPQVVDNYLILYRVGKKENIPYDELPLGWEMGEFIAVPLVGYPVQHCKPEEVVNDDYEKTGIYRPDCSVSVDKSAPYISLKEDSKQVFKYHSKLDIFPSDFFDGSWYALRTVIKSSEKNISDLGHQAFQSALLVEFKKTAEGLKAVDASGYNLKEEDKLAGFFIPVKWKDYKMDRESNILKKFVEKEDTSLPDVERSYFQIQFEKWMHKNELKSISIADNYFSCVVEVLQADGSMRWFKFSFFRAKKNTGYLAKKWYESDSSLFFPSFVTQRSHYVDSSLHTQADKGKFYRTTRFDPKRKTIKWYFSKQTPADEALRQVGRRAVEYWNTVFQIASSGKLSIILDETEDKELGDIRFNIINLIKTKSSSRGGLMGFGPNVANPVTGEVVSATANVWVTRIVDSYVSLLRRYIRFHVYPPKWKILPDSPGVSDFMHKQIQNLCPGVLEFIAQNKNKDVFHPEDSVLHDKEIVQTCSWHLAQDSLLGVVLHEMGHGFGLRHVFSASADKDNYYDSYEQIGDIFGPLAKSSFSEKDFPVPQYSSVMDYSQLEFPKLTVPGKYDLAAIRFIYFDEVELDTGEFVKVPSSFNNQESIKDVLERIHKSAKQYKVCGGKLPKSGSPSEVHLNDPLCAPFDYGSTPLEVVSNYIRYSQDSLMTKMRRYDSSELYDINNLVHDLNPANVLRLMNKWGELLNLLLKQKEEKIFHFSAYRQEDIDRYENLIREKADNDPFFKEYYKIRQPVFEFFKNLFFMPARQCIYKDTNSSYKMESLDVIISRIAGKYPEDSREVVMDCESPAVQAWAEENGFSSLFQEVGFLGRQRSYFLRETHEDLTDELLFFVPYKLNANSRFSKDYPSLWANLLHSLSPILFMEPGFRKQFREDLLSYLLEGADISKYAQDEELFLFPRLPSYQIDSQVEILPRRIMRYLHVQQELYKNRLSDDSLREEILQDTGTFCYKISRFHDDVSRPLINEESHKEIKPLAEDLYKEFLMGKADQEKTPEDFTFFVSNHDATYKIEDREAFCMPVSRDSFFTPLFKKFNANKKCIENNTDLNPCPDLKHKEGFNISIQKIVNIGVNNSKKF